MIEVNRKSDAKAVALREKAARQLRASEEAAKEVADLCFKAAEQARRHHLPHAGVGKTYHSDD